MLLALGLLAFVWIAVTGLVARNQLLKARADVTAIKAALLDGRTSEAQRLADQLADRASSAHRWTSGPAWWAGAHVPGLGSPLKTVRALTAAVDDLAGTALPAAVRGGKALAPNRVLVGDGQLDLDSIGTARRPLAEAASNVARVRNAVVAAPADTWLNLVDDKRNELLDQLGELAVTMANGAKAAELLPPMLGADGTRRYIVVFQNNAESKGLGGLPGVFGELVATNGKLTMKNFVADDVFRDTRVQVNFGYDYDVRYIQNYGVDHIIYNTGMSPHLPYDAGLWLSYWEKHFGQRPDGVITTDPSALGYLLGATGPAQLADGTEVTADNAASFFEQQAYAKFPDESQVGQRKAYLVDAAKAIADHVTQSAGTASGGLVSAMGRAVGERRLLVYSDHPREQAELATEPLSGIIPNDRDPFAMVVVNNSAGTKLDYYLDRSMTYTRQSCAKGKAIVEVTLTNDTPPGVLPPYVTKGILTGDPPPGTNRLVVSYYSTKGATVDRVDIDGNRAYVSAGLERGHDIVDTEITFAPGASHTIKYTVTEPAADGPLRIPIQPLVRPMQLKVDAPSC